MKIPIKYHSQIKKMIKREKEAQKVEIIKMIEGKKGMSNNTDYFRRLIKELDGNIATKGLDNFQISQISWEAKDLIIDDIIKEI